ncbi:MAG: UDP-N-acetylmuramate--L-alanine ligase [Marinifilaceae bacterium]
MKVHFIAIGGSAMHNLAIALHLKGFQVTGSDDEIFNPSKSRLEKHGILPNEWGWFPEKITSDLDAIILGMHAREDNPELQEAKKIGLRIYSYPEYIYEQTKNKTRVVIGGSHGKTTTTSMIMHVLKENGIDFDYMVGAQLDGFETMVKLTHEAPIAIFEGDEYLASPIDRRPKFHLYHPHIAMLTGIAWDHINVFPTFDNYLDQFGQFIELIEDKGSLIYFEGDQHLQNLVSQSKNNITKIPYKTPAHKTKGNQTILIHENGETPLQIFGQHNLQNLNGAFKVCQQLGVTDVQFYSAIQNFSGAAKRLQKLEEKENTSVYMDFAHSPSKLKATTQAVKEQYPSRKLIACMELHTFSSLKEDFLPQYRDSMKNADEAIVYFNPETLNHKKLPSISIKQVEDAFGGDNLKVYTDSNQMLESLVSRQWNDANLLLMSSGNFSGIDLPKLAKTVIEKLE